jgi:hypothetical protein
MNGTIPFFIIISMVVINLLYFHRRARPPKSPEAI